MPISKRRRRRGTGHPAAEDDEARAARVRREDFQRRAGWTLAIVGGALFIVGQIGAQTGAVSLPLDRHHLISQVAGFFLLIRGLTWAWR